MATVVDLVTESLGELIVLSSGETPSAGDALKGLTALNRMVNAWKAEKVFIFNNTATTKVVTSGVGTYTVGIGGDLAVLRPLHLTSVNISDAVTTPPYEMSLRMMTDQDWAEVRIKTQTAYRPQACYYNLTYPLATLYLWPIPTSATLSIVLYAPEAVAEFAGLSTVVSLPPGFERMIVKNLALELAPSFGATPSPQLERQAQDALAVVLRSNKNLEEQRFDPGALMRRRYYDVYSDLS
jgi:hypothetical protein